MSANTHTSHRPRFGAPRRTTPTSDDHMPSEPHPDQAQATARAQAEDGLGGARASATVHVAVPPADRAATLLRIRQHERVLQVGRRIDRQLGRLAAAMLVLAGAVVALAIVLAAGAPWG